MIWKLSDVDDFNCFGVIDCVVQFDYWGLDWVFLKIDI